MNKKLLLLAGILVLGATTFSADTVTGSYTGQVDVASYQGNGRSDDGIDDINTIEWTLGKGSVNMDKVGFAYDVDRDYKFDKDWNKTREGWDTEFGLNYKAGTFDMMGKEWTLTPKVTYGYDTLENYTSDSKTPNAIDTTTKRLWKAVSTVATTYNGFDVDINPIVAYDAIDESTAFKVEINNSRSLGTSGLWSTSGTIYLDFAGSEGDSDYGNDVFEGNVNGDNKFAISIEQYLNYEKEIASNIYFATEFGYEGYSLLQSDESDAALYVQPALKHKMTLGSVNVISYLKYTSYTATGGYEDSYKKEEASAGVIFSTKF